MVDSTNAANQEINTMQPTPLRGLVLRGVHKTEMVMCEGAPGGRPCRVNVANYDRKLHGKKVEEGSGATIPTRKKKVKKNTA